MKKEKIINITLVVVCLLSFVGAVSSQSEALPAVMCGINVVVSVAGLAVNNILK